MIVKFITSIDKNNLKNKWGTASRIDFYDKEYDIHTSVGGNGSYRFRLIIRIN